MLRSLVFIFALGLLSSLEVAERPVIYLIGDSTVKNGSGKGEGGLWGWGDFLVNYIDTTKVKVENRARGGRSSRTYQSEGLWENVLSQVKAGDYVIMQFGHNDGGPVNDTIRARGSIRGTGEETEEIDNLITKKHEIVHSFGWYMRKYIRDTKSKGAVPIVCSLVARNMWKDGKVERATDTYTRWAADAAKSEGAYFIDLNDRVASEYERLGAETVKSKLFLVDHTHTTAEGAKINAQLVVNALSEWKDLPLRKLVKK